MNRRLNKHLSFQALWDYLLQRKRNLELTQEMGTAITQRRVATVTVQAQPAPNTILAAI